MDASAITSMIGPVVKPLIEKFPNGRNGSVRGNVGSVDTALGAAATLGILALMARVVRYQKSFRSKNDDDDSARRRKTRNETTILYSVLQILRLRSTFVKKTTKNADGDPFFATVSRDRKAGDDEGEDDSVTYRGSCHCSSIEFTLRSKGELRALDCTGKIRFPHIYTNASDFRLTKGGSSCLQTYYVSLPSDETERSTNPKENGGDDPNSVQSTTKTDSPSSTAAHAFCNRCGVHILRAPDSKKEVLEINALCLDLTSPEEKFTVTFYDSKDKLGAGTAAPNQWNDEEDENKTPSRGGDSKINSPFGFASESRTESTTMTSRSSSDGNVQADQNLGLSLMDDSSSQGSVAGVGSWAVTSSLKSDSDSTPQTKNTNYVEPTKTTRDQLKYYMARHLSSSTVNNGE